MSYHKYRSKLLENVYVAADVVQRSSILTFMFYLKSMILFSLWLQNGVMAILFVCLFCLLYQFLLCQSFLQRTLLLELFLGTAKAEKRGITEKA